MKIEPDDFKVAGNKKIDLKKWPTRIDPYYQSKDDYKQRLDDSIDELSDTQELLYASNKYAILLIFQAMDAAGKDSTIKHVMTGVNPQGCQVHAFKHPSALELEHDFLWRSTIALPERGNIGIFNRSYYEEVLVVRVHPEIFAAENIPDLPRSNDDVWEGRYRSIREFEQHLHRNGTRIMKFFLHVSKDEQRQRFFDRIDTPKKNWKFSESDLHERAYWDQYMSAYQDCLAATSTAEAPWYVVPADDKENMRLIVSSIIAGSLQKLKMGFPALGKERVQELALLRKRLEID